MTDLSNPTAVRLNELLRAASLTPLDAPIANQFGTYCALLLRWNARTNLTAIRDEEGILSRHFVESIACARALPSGVVTLLDFGSGAGFPGIPIALCRPEITVTLAESQSKKAAFLREVARTLDLSTKIHSARAETLTRKFDCVILRAVDHMGLAAQAATDLVAPEGWLALMTTTPELDSLKASIDPEFVFSPSVLLPGGESRVLALAQRPVLKPRCSTWNSPSQAGQCSTWNKPS
jgi:16S rRNA (guanine527-N7)-methyltransferase